MSANSTLDGIVNSNNPKWARLRGWSVEAVAQHIQNISAAHLALPIQGKTQISDFYKEDTVGPNYMGFTLDECMSCDMCGASLDCGSETWVRWWYDIDKQATLHVWVTCGWSEDMSCTWPLLDVGSAIKKPERILFMDYVLCANSTRPPSLVAFNYQWPVRGLTRVFAYLWARRFLDKMSEAPKAKFAKTKASKMKRPKATKPKTKTTPGDAASPEKDRRAKWGQQP